jgi:hypothetical protein
MRARTAVLSVTMLIAAPLALPAAAFADPPVPFIAPAAPVSCPNRADLVATSSSGGATSYTWICPARGRDGGAQVWFAVCDTSPDGHHAEGEYVDFNTSQHKFLFGPTVLALGGYRSCTMASPSQPTVRITDGSEFNGFARTYDKTTAIDSAGISSTYTLNN